MSDIEIKTFDFRSILATMTDTKPESWVEGEGPETGVGIDYWYLSEETGEWARVNLDQFMLSISFSEEDGEEKEETREFNLEELSDEDRWIEAFISSAPASSLQA